MGTRERPALRRAGPGARRELLLCWIQEGEAEEASTQAVCSELLLGGLEAGCW